MDTPALLAHYNGLLTRLEDAVGPFLGLSHDLRSLGHTDLAQRVDGIAVTLDEARYDLEQSRGDLEQALTTRDGEMEEVESAVPSGRTSCRIIGPRDDEH